MIMFFFWPVGFPLTHNLGFVQKHLAKTTTSQPHEPQPVHKVLKENLLRYIFSCLKCLLNTSTIFCIRLNSLWILRQRHNLFVYPWVYFPLLIWRCTPKAKLRPFHASKSICPSAPPPIQPSMGPECLDVTQSSLVLPLYVHHSLSLALGACLDTGHDRGYTYPHPHTVINTVSTTFLQVHQ